MGSNPVIILGAVGGGLIGLGLNWAADFLPRYAASGPVAPSKSFRSPWVNRAVVLLSAMLFAWLWSQSAPALTLFLLTLLCAFLILVAVIDLRYRLVLNVLVFPAMALTLLIRFAAPEANMLAVLLGGGFGFAIFALAAFLRPGELGGGDVKLATLIGWMFGFPDALWALMIGVLAGGVIAVLMLATQRGNAQSQIPYAPFLCLGALIALFYNPVSVILHPFVGH